ncbi:ATP-binding cassette, subfamily F, uup [Acetitomaculum ruminis DSM 5522]|uniref:ATP-binding cassette, subfamily F, uup n=1 Tax=Acetitomaculum ruminis DSM 5522 TaxID=1120918 RepID=A0A1I0VR43_9FIRM|nr:ABC-F family ATP-binding cassette domain-containing protein [Acetitomaculum ruminis]SFA78463.1 ATP-binding cassette, subfamily F, uup [Acetitomaculum ruminis DSM 5522]
MNLITATDMVKVFTERKILDKADFSIDEGEKIGVIGVNGTGKTSFLRILAGIESIDSGKIVKANNIVINFLPQDFEFEADTTILECVTNYVKNSYGNYEEDWDEISKAVAMLNRFGIEDTSKKVSELSGGQRKRVALTCSLLKKCDVLILDEPTNHLDSEMANWLENYLKNIKQAVIMVTHDRYFLDSVSNRIVELDKGKIYSYKANYAGFLELKQQRLDYEKAGLRKRRAILDKEIAWLKRGARARSTKQKAHIQRVENLMQNVGPIVEDGKVEMESVSSRLGRTTIELENISKSYDGKVLIDNFTYIFLKNDRIGFIGKNGCGKTTLMKIIDKRLEADSGKLVIGPTVKIGYYAQEISNDKSAGIAYMDPEIRVIDYIKNTAEYVRTNDGLVSASSMLERFLFTPDIQYNQIKKLSGGEKRRLNLLRVLMEAPNVLILDEPTNDLDITTLAILEDYLDTFAGIVITVSHDRYFLDRVVRRIFAFEENGIIKQYEGGYTDYKNAVGENNISNSKGEVVKEKKSFDKVHKREHEKKLRFTFKEQKEYETIEEDIEALENKISIIEDEILKCASDFVKLNELSKEKESLEEQLSLKMERWEYLSELDEKIKNQ